MTYDDLAPFFGQTCTMQVIYRTGKVEERYGLLEGIDFDRIRMIDAPTVDGIAATVDDSSDTEIHIDDIEWIKTGPP